MVQILNAILDTLMWASYDFSIPASTVAGLTVFFTVLLVTIKVAAEKMTSKTEPEHLR